MNTYIIGDVHGQYNTLLALVAKLPKDAKLVFVGDLIDRGYFSKEVVAFVRKGNHLCVMGNHEELMIDHAPYALNAYEEERNLDLYSTWFTNGGTKTLLSYDVIQLIEGKPYKVDNYQEALALIRDDIEWMKKLPLYLMLDISHPSKKPVVVSHACVGAVWQHHDSEKGEQTFKEYALWNRKNPPIDMPIFNIFGHTPVEFGVEIEDSYVNVDTGCYINQHGYAELSAYCVESAEVVSVYRVKEDKKW
jgi:serine/threonine protein phosphatase 1